MGKWIEREPQDKAKAVIAVLLDKLNQYYYSQVYCVAIRTGTQMNLTEGTKSPRRDYLYGFFSAFRSFSFDRWAGLIDESLQLKVFIGYCILRNCFDWLVTQ